MTAAKTCGILYVVATPIGNLADLSERAREVLHAVDLIAAEDTRHSGKLLQQIGAKAPMISLHEHNERQRSGELLEHLRSGKDIALISDAGTPLISDPGFNLVRELIEQDIRVVPVPGACAAIAALSISGLPTDRFAFDGFLPSKASKRREHLESLRNEARTLVFYESPHRIQESLTEMRNIFGAERRAAVCRELTKVYETAYHGTLAELSERAVNDADMLRGEIVLVIAGDVSRQAGALLNAEMVLDVLLAELPASQAAKLAAKLCDVDRGHMYELAVKRKTRN